jgi:hypothetical protein
LGGAKAASHRQFRHHKSKIDGVSWSCLAVAWFRARLRLRETRSRQVRQPEYRATRPDAVVAAFVGSDSGLTARSWSGNAPIGAENVQDRGISRCAAPDGPYRRLLRRSDRAARLKPSRPTQTEPPDPSGRAARAQPCTPATPQPRRRPHPQPRPARHRHHPTTQRPHHHRLHPPTTRTRQTDREITRCLARQLHRHMTKQLTT